MKKLILFFCILFLSNSIKSQVSTIPQKKKVVIEMFGGHTCPYDQYGHKVANLIMQNNPNKAYIINIHAGAYANTTPNYKTAIGDTMS